MICYFLCRKMITMRRQLIRFLVLIVRRHFNARRAFSVTCRFTPENTSSFASFVQRVLPGNIFSKNTRWSNTRAGNFTVICVVRDSRLEPSWMDTSDNIMALQVFISEKSEFCLVDIHHHDYIHMCTWSSLSNYWLTGIRKLWTLKNWALDSVQCTRLWTWKH